MNAETDKNKGIKERQRNKNRDILWAAEWV